MPPTVISSSASHHTLSSHHHHIPTPRERSIYSSSLLSSAGINSSSNANLKRQRSSTLESSPESKSATADRHSTSKVPPTPGKKTSLLQKKPAVPSSLYIKTHRKTASSTVSRSNLGSPLSPRPPASQSVTSPTGPPPKKKSPARYSSNGISTTSGPPPSLAYRRATQMEQRQHGSGTGSGTATGSGTSAISGRGGGSINTVTIRGGGGIVRKAEVTEERRGSTTDSETDKAAFVDDKDQDRTIRGLEDLPRQHFIKPSVEEEDEDTAMTDADSNKDLFLSLAKADPPKLLRGLSTKSRLGERKSRLAQRSSMPADASPASRGNAPDFPVSPLSQVRNNRRSVPVPMVDALAEALEHGPRDSQSRQTSSSLKRESSGGLERLSAADRISRGSQFKSLSPSPLQNDRTIASMIDQDRAAPKGNNSGAEDTASTVSTNAASVWDELDDLKSRIRKLELTGSINGFGKGATSDSSGGRPRTATTSATTLSSSPRHNTSAHGNSPGAAPVSHPLLHTALSKTQHLIAPEVYKSLESSARDALSLAEMLGSNGTNGALDPPPSSHGAISDRTVRRKVDSLCRSLTELCIALSEARSNIANATVAAAAPTNGSPPSSLSQQHPHLLGVGRPITREGGVESTRDFLEERGIRTGRDSVLSDRKVLGRYDSTRRPSVQNLIQPAASPALQPSISYSDMARRPPPPISEIIPASKLARASMLLKARREQVAASTAAQRAAADRDDQVDHIMQDLDLQGAGSYRAPSRATTDVLRTRRRIDGMAPQDREREIEQLTQELRRPSLYHNRNSSNSTITQGGSVAQRGSPLSQLRTVEEPGQSSTIAMDRATRRAQLTRSLIDTSTSSSLASPMSPVESTRRFFDDRERQQHRNTIHGERLEGFTSPRYSGMEAKRKSLSAVQAAAAGRALRAATEFDEDVDMGGQPDRSLGASEGRRFLRRRAE